MDVRTIYEALLHEPFPCHPDDDELSDWSFELLEMDTFYAGLLHSAMGGSALKVVPSASDIERLRRRLDDIEARGSAHRADLDQCRRRLELLTEAHDVLMR
jgi:hypothetical protein